MVSCYASLQYLSNCVITTYEIQNTYLLIYRLIKHAYEIMKLILLLCLFMSVNIQIASARNIYRPCPEQKSSIIEIIKNLATPNVSAKKCARNEQLILPPAQIELPTGLGYFPSAVPFVASCFEPAVDRGMCSVANIPVASPCSCLTLAAPISPEWAPLVRSLIL